MALACSDVRRHSTGGYPGASYGAHAGHPQDEGPYRGQGWTPQQQWGSPRDGAMPHSASPQAAAMATGVRFGVGGAGFGGRAVSTGGYDDSSAGGTGWQMGGGAAMPWKAGMSPRGVGDMGMYGGDRDGMGAAGYGAGYANLAPAGQAYFAWTHDSRQKILEKYFAEDHAKKVRLLVICTRQRVLGHAQRVLCMGPLQRLCSASHAQQSRPVLCSGC